MQHPACAFEFTTDLISVYLVKFAVLASTLFGLLVNAFSRIFFPVEFCINSLGFVAYHSNPRIPL